MITPVSRIGKDKRGYHPSTTTITSNLKVIKMAENQVFRQDCANSHQGWVNDLKKVCSVNQAHYGTFTFYNYNNKESVVH